MRRPAWRGGRTAAAADANQAQAAHEDAPDRLAGFRVFRQRRVLHALVDFVAAHFAAGLGRDGFVNVSRHGNSYSLFPLHLAPKPRRTQAGFCRNSRDKLDGLGPAMSVNIAPVTMSEKPRICITDFITDDLAVEKQILGDLAEVHALGAESERQLEGRVEDAACIMMYHFVSLGAATIGRLRQCKLIVRCGVGIDNVDAAAARGRGIPVCNVPDYGTEDVADTAMAMMLTLTRGTHLMNSRLRSARGVWNYTQAAPVRRLRGRVFAVIGMGRIGTAVSVRARAFGMDVVFYDPYVPDGWDSAHGVRRA